MNGRTTKKRSGRIPSVVTGVLVLLGLGCGPASGDEPDMNQPPSAADLLNRLDQDGDGKISKSEFDGPAEHFSQFDTNGDGYLTEDEIPDGPPPRGRGPQQGQR